MTQKHLSLRRKWRAWIEGIGHDLGLQVMNRQIFTEVDGLFKDYPKSLLFQWWLVSNYLASCLMVARRHLDSSGGSASLRKLLEDIRKNPDAILRNSFVSEYVHAKGEATRAFAEGLFDKLAGPGQKHVTKKRIEIDLSELVNKKITTLVNRYIAHWDPVETPIPPPELDVTAEDVNECMDLLVELFDRYEHLLLGPEYKGRVAHAAPLAADFKDELKKIWSSTITGAKWSR